MAETAVQTGLIRTFTTCERTVLRARHVDEFVAAGFPEHLSVIGICDLLEAGVPADVAHQADSSLSAAAVIGFLAVGADLSDVDYDDRFESPRFLADAGLPASVANAYPHHLSDIDIVRLEDAGFGPRDCADFDASWDISEMVSMAAVGVTAQQADVYRRIPGLPPEMLGECVRANLDPDALAQWLAVVGPVIRTAPATLVRTALASGRLDDPVGFRFDLLRVAARSVLSAANEPAQCRVLAQLLLDVVQRGGTLSTTIPDSWTRERLLFVGPDGDDVVSIIVIPDEALVFSHGDVGFDEACARIRRHIDSVSQPAG